MRFKPEMLGVLVRPRILAEARILSLNNAPFDLESILSKKPLLNQFSIFDLPFKELCQTLHLGNTSESLATSYVGEVTHYIVKIAGTPVLVDKTNVQDVMRRIKKLLGARTNMKVLSVGVKFYQGMDNINNELKPHVAWNTKTKDGHETIWFFKPWKLVAIQEIIKYESVEKGDLILFQKCNGLVVKKKLLNKPKFYRTSSWSCYSITLLNHTADGFTRFLPDRQFTIKKREG
jgi:hypothetical protein